MSRSLDEIIFNSGWRLNLARILGLLARFPQPLLQLCFRIGVAGVFFRAGLGKIQSWPATVQLFRDEYRVPLIPPEIAASMAAAVELTCPVLLVLGLASRLATLPMLAMSLVIGLWVYPAFIDEQILWAGPLLFILTRGPGSISVDCWIRPIILGGRK
jgi:putative oxidoreductase